MATPKQEKLIKLLMENYGAKKNTKPLGELMLEAGYSEASAKNPKLIIESEEIQNGISEFVSMLDDKRRMAIVKLTDDKLEKSSAKDLASIVDVLTKNHQLLTGGETDNLGVKTIIIQKSE